MDRGGDRIPGARDPGLVVLPAPTRLLVLGGTGFIGSEVVARALDDGLDVSVLARHRPSVDEVHWSGDVTWYLGDATVRADLLRAVDGVDWVVDAVASPPPAADPGISGEVGQPDGTALTLVLELLRGRSDVGLTFLSSGGAVYGEVGTLPVAEAQACAPISNYGMSKLRAEQAIVTHATRFGTPTRILRVANAFGPSQSSSDGQGLVAACMDAAEGDRCITVFGDGSSVRDYVTVADVASAVLGLLPGGRGPGTVNVGSGVGHAVRQVIDLVADVSGVDLEVTWAPARRQDVHSIILDTQQLRELLPWDPTPFGEGVASVWDRRRCTGAWALGSRIA